MVYLADIRTVVALSNGTHGSPRMHRDLVDEGHGIGRHRTARLMRENRLIARQKRRFAMGAALPLIVTLLVPKARIGLFAAASSIVGLAILGGLGASVGGAAVVRGAARVTFWGALAMAATAAIGAVFWVAVG